MPIGFGCGIVSGVFIGYLVFSAGKPQWVVIMVEDGPPRKGRRMNKKRGERS